MASQARENVCAIYARVSQRDQQPENQLRELRGFARAQSFEVFKEFVDHGESGARVFANPDSEHSKLRELARRGKMCPFGSVLVWRFDRFARSARELHNALFEFEQAGIRFLSLKDQVDTRSAIGKMIFSILAGVAEMELAITRERIFAGLDRARAEGKRLGRPPACQNGKIALALELRSKGLSFGEIARALHLSKATAFRVVSKT